MGQKATYYSDGHYPVVVDMEDVKLAEMYLRDGMDFHDVCCLFGASKGNLSGPFNIVCAARSRIQGDHDLFEIES